MTIPTPIPPIPVSRAVHQTIKLVVDALPKGPTGAAQPGHFLFDMAVSKVNKPEELYDVIEQFGRYALTEEWPDGWPTVSDLVLLVRGSSA
jgi:hypothetical protein